MGARKRLRAESIKENKKSIAFAKLNNSNISPRKMRLVADLIRGIEVHKALGILQFSQKEAATRLELLLQSAMHNYEAKTGSAVNEGELKISTIAVDSGRMLKRVQPAPQGRAHRVRKRSNHVTLFIDKIAN